MTPPGVHLSRAPVAPSLPCHSNLPSYGRKNPRRWPPPRFLNPQGRLPENPTTSSIPYREAIKRCLTPPHTLPPFSPHLPRPTSGGVLKTTRAPHPPLPPPATTEELTTATCLSRRCLGPANRPLTYRENRSRLLYSDVGTLAILRPERGSQGKPNRNLSVGKSADSARDSDQIRPRGSFVVARQRLVSSRWELL